MAKELRLIKMSDVEVEEIKGIWHPYIPQGKVTIIQGDPGEGKTTLVLALLTQGLPLPECDTVCEAMNVIYQTYSENAHRSNAIRLISGKDCCPETVFAEFMATKNTFRKSGDMMFYHYTQSFKDGEAITPPPVNANSIMQFYASQKKCRKVAVEQC